MRLLISLLACLLFVSPVGAETTNLSPPPQSDCAKCQPTATPAWIEYERTQGRFAGEGLAEKCRQRIRTNVEPGSS